MVKITKSVAQKRLADVPVEKQFWCHDGRYLKSLQEMEAALKQMADETFRYHANKSKNDFSNWVRDVIGDEKLSRDLIKSTTHTQGARSVAERIVFLKKRIETK